MPWRAAAGFRPACPRPSCRASTLARAPISGTAAYETARNFGLDYGATFQLLREAVRIGEDRIEAVINPPAAARNPYVTYSLHPVSVDAAFHGLVAAFGDISGEVRGAPYIPVRFGCARLYQPGVTIRRAMIHIGRMSAGSIKADFTFLSTAGDVVATFEDCRFKRTYLHQHKPLGDVSYHQTLIPSRVSPFRATPLEIDKTPLFPEPGEDQAMAHRKCSRRRSIAPATRLPARQAEIPASLPPLRCQGTRPSKVSSPTASICSRKWALRQSPRRALDDGGGVLVADGPGDPECHLSRQAGPHRRDRCGERGVSRSDRSVSTRFTRLRTVRRDQDDTFSQGERSWRHDHRKPAGALSGQRGSDTHGDGRIAVGTSPERSERRCVVSSNSAPCRGR